MENQQKEIFANCSQTHFAMRKFRRPISQCENSPIPISQSENFAMRNFAMPNAISQCQNRFRNANFKFRNAKISQCEISQCQMPFRNAKISQCEISQCQIPFRNANFKFALPIPISQCENFAVRNFAMPKPISHCEIHCLCEIEICRPCHPL